MKRLLLAIALTCVLSGSTLAGEVHSTGEPEPGEIHTAGEPTPGEIPSVGSTSPGDIPTIGLSALLTMLDIAF